VFGAVVLVSTLALLWAVSSAGDAATATIIITLIHTLIPCPAPATRPPAAQPQEADAAPPSITATKDAAAVTRAPAQPHLAETGGLPPVRSDDPPGPSA